MTAPFPPTVPVAVPRGPFAARPRVRASRPVVALVVANTVVLVVVGGLVTMALLLASAMSVDSCGTGSGPDPFLCTGVPVFGAFLVQVGGLILGVVLAALACSRRGWGVVGFAAGGWGLWLAAEAVALGGIWLSA